MKSKFSSYSKKKKDNKSYSMMFHKYYDSLNNGLSEEESYNRAISLIDDCKRSSKR